LKERIKKIGDVNPVRNSSPAIAGLETEQAFAAPAVLVHRRGRQALALRERWRSGLFQTG